MFLKLYHQAFIARGHLLVAHALLVKTNISFGSSIVA